MSLKNINPSPRFTKYLVASQAFASEPFIIVDIGARGGFEPYWSLYRDQVKLLGFEANVKECERLNRKTSKSGNRFFPIALHQDRGTRPFYVTALPDSSGFYPPDMQFWQRFPDEVNLVIEKTIEMDTVDFDSFASENDIDSVDFIKLDTEGSELDILKGAIKFIKKSVLGLSIEVEFLQAHKEQPVFSDVDSFLKPLGFRLYDLAIYRHSRKALPVPTFSPIPGAVERGQVIWGQALYLRDGVSEIESSSSLEDGWDDMKVLKTASIMELFCLPDCAIELIQVAQRKGFLQGWDIQHLIDLVVSSAARRNIVIGRTKQLSIKFLPRPVLLAARDFLVKLKYLIDEIVK